MPSLRPVLVVLLLVLLGASIVAGESTADATTAPLFDRSVLSTSINNPTALAFGPDGRLYAASETAIVALTLDETGEQVLGAETIATGQTNVLGIAFDPTAPPSPIVVYASRQELTTDSYEGRISTYTAPSWTRQDVITGLPSSRPHTNHYTNGIAFNSTGRLFMAQGSNTDAGLQGPFYPETPLSAAILYADVNAPSFNGTITYNPSTVPTNDNVDQTGGQVYVFAAGTRNPFDLVVHSNGYVYASDNGATGPNTSTSCTTQGTGVSQSDELNLIEPGNYYGFPNRNRGRTDPRQCVYHTPESGSGSGFTGPLAVLPAHCSCDGLAEYASNAHGGAMQGNLILAQFVLGNVARFVLAPDGRSVLSVTTLDTGFSLPLDVTVRSDGRIYVAEYGADRIAVLSPRAKAVGGLAGAPQLAREGGALPWAVLVSIALAATIAVVMGRRALQR